MSTTVIERAAELLLKSRHAIAFTGAGISLESGIPTFRDSPDSIWNMYDPDDLSLDRFKTRPEKCWRTIKAIFYDFMIEHDVKPNKAHYVMASMQKKGLLKTIITQNIDALHQRAGATDVVEFHGNSVTASCMRGCGYVVGSDAIDLSVLPPRCPNCGGLLKPDFVFFGESIPTEAYSRSIEEVGKADLCLIVGTSAQVQPAAMIPVFVHRNGGQVIEVNPNPSVVTDGYVDLHIEMGAVDAFPALGRELGL